MRWFIAIVLFAANVMSASVDSSAQLSGLKKLKEALAFVDTELDKQHPKPFENFLRLGIDAEYLTVSRGNTRLANEVQKIPSKNFAFRFIPNPINHI